MRAQGPCPQVNIAVSVMIEKVVSKLPKYLFMMAVILAVAVVMFLLYARKKYQRSPPAAVTRPEPKVVKKEVRKTREKTVVRKQR